MKSPIPRLQNSITDCPTTRSMRNFSTFWRELPSSSREREFRYKPFGDMLVVAGAAGWFQYAQQEYDGSAVRQYHMGLRYQDPVVGRWIQRDPIGDGYEYALNDPITLGGVCVIRPIAGMMPSVTRRRFDRLRKKGKRGGLTSPPRYGTGRPSALGIPQQVRCSVGH